jgi:hypothetical protein
VPSRDYCHYEGIMEYCGSAESEGGAKSRRDKLQALSLGKECYAMKLDLLSSATIVDRAKS